MSVHVSDRELANSFTRLTRDGAVLNGPGGNLLCCYAVECGLKAALLRRSNKRSTRELATTFTTGSSGHDLRALAKKLYIAETNYADIDSCRRRPPSTEVLVGAAEVHQAWRYGAGLEPDDEARFVAGLVALASWCRKELQS